MRSIFVLFVSLVIISCNVYETVEGQSSPSDNFFDSNKNDNDSSYPDIPTGISLTNSSLSDGGVDQTPTLSVSGVASGDTVSIYTDSGCSSSVGSATASGSSVEVTVQSSSKLTSTGSYTYYASANRSGIESACSSVSITYSFTACPSGFISVPANSTYTNEDFCVAQYEMRSGPASQSSGTPQVSINKATAESNCTGMGSGYDLIANHQWQTIARDIEQNGSNWSTGTVGSGQLNQGYHVGSISAVCDSANENMGSNPSACSSTGSSFENKRTHNLSNGNIIWDLSGNATEWIKDTKASSDFAAATSLLRISLVTTSDPGTSISLSDGVSRNFKDQFGTSTDYSSSLTSSPFGGLGGMDNITSTSNSMYRGGSYGSGAMSAGVFAISVTGSTSSFTNLGYRCVYTK